MYKKIMLFSLLFLLFLQQSMAQTKTVTGKVTDDKGAPVSGASVIARGSKTGTSTDADGSFKLSVPASARALTVSSVGFSSQDVVIGTGNGLAVSLVPQSSSLNDVVVVGYGTARKKDITGAVSTISTKDFNQGLINNPMDQVNGKVAGLVITNADGDPNGNPVIRLRGQTSLLGTQTPLLVVDGIILDNYELLSSIPPADIITFDFLKDASASAIYGSRAANGVVIITTKSGKAGSFQVDYTGSAGIAKDAKYFDLYRNASSFLNEAVKLGIDTTGLNQGGNTDWQKAITQTGYSQTHNLGISGGTGNFTYRGSLYYQNQQGIVLNTGKQQLGLRLTADQKALDGKLDIQMNILNTETNHQNIDANIFYWAYNLSPTIPEYTNGVLTPINNYNYLNPVFVEQNEVRKTVDYLKQDNITANYEIIKGLKAGLTGNISRLNTQGDYYLPQIPGVGSMLTQAAKLNSNTNSDKGDVHVNYIGSFGKSNVTATGVYEYNYYETDLFTASSEGFPIDATQNNALGSGISTYNTLNSNKYEFKLISFLARATYNYDSKYYLTASIRRDGSSKFGTDHAWGNFPSVSAAWRLSQEGFLKNVSWIDELKLNAGYGITGNSDPIGPYNTLFLMGASSHYYDPSNSGNLYPVGYSAVQNPNPDLRWERRIGRNIGIEYSFLKNRIAGGVSYFNDLTKDMLYNYGVPSPPFAVNSIFANVGEMTNKGVEFSINVAIVRNKDVDWSVGGQITSTDTKITSLNGTFNGIALETNHVNTGSAGGQGLSFNPLTYLQVGYNPNVFYLPHFTGIDQNGNQLMDSAHVKSVGINGNPTYYYVNPDPKFTYGFNSKLRYKNWNASVAFVGNYGQKVYDNARLNMANYNRFPGLNSLKEFATNGLKDNPTTSDYWLEKASYLRLQNLTIGYSFPKINQWIQGLQVYATGNNLFIITKYKGLDPEIAGVAGANGSRGAFSSLATSLSSNYGSLGGSGTGSAYLDNNYAGNGFYPRARTYTLGVSITVK